MFGKATAQSCDTPRLFIYLWLDFRIRSGFVHSDLQLEINNGSNHGFWF